MAMKKIVLLLVFLFPVCLMAQQDRDWNNFLKQHNFNEYKKQHDEKFQAFKDSLNKEFAKAMEQRWEDFQVFVAKKRPVKPEPVELPVAPKDSVIKEPMRLPIEQVIPTSESEQPEQDANREESITVDTSSGNGLLRNMDVNFYRQEMTFDVPTSYEQLLLGGISERAVAKFWMDLSDGAFETSLIQLRNKKKELHLNDWALYDLIKSMSNELFPKRFAEQTVFSVFMLNQLGLDAKIGKTTDQLLILLPAKTTIYAVPYVINNNTTYYIFSCYPKDQQNIASINTYPMAFPGFTSPFDLNINEPISFVRQPSSVTYTTDYWGDAVPYNVNQNAIDFYGRYPQVDIVIYANAEMSDELKIWLESQMKPFLDELDEVEAVSVLLNYVQTEFDYATDIQQFGFEKPFFCEENFYYSKNDCEDRAILMSYLVRNLVGARMVLLDYPDHIATAIAFKDDSEIHGDYYLIDGRKYYVCDPTYIGANIGESMPQYKNIRANVIMLKEKIN